MRHDAFISRDHQHHGVEPVRPGQHVADEPRMAGDIDDADVKSARELQVREAEVDGHAAPLFFGETVGVDAGQRGDQGRLAVVYVPGRPDDIVALTRRRGHRVVTLRTATSTASISVSSSPFKTVRGSRQHASFSMRAITGGSP